MVQAYVLPCAMSEQRSAPDPQQPRIGAFFKRAPATADASDDADRVAKLVARDDARKRKVDEERLALRVVESVVIPAAPSAVSAFAVLGRGRRKEAQPVEAAVRGRKIGTTTRPKEERQAEEELQARKRAQREAEKNAILEGFDSLHDPTANLRKVLLYVRDQYKQLFRYAHTTLQLCVRMCTV